MACPPYTKFSAALILVLAATLQMLEQEATVFNTTLLLLGTSSLVHHSRLHKWFVHDAIQMVDVVLCIVVGVVCCRRYGDDLVLVVALSYIVASILAIWVGLIPSATECDIRRVSALHCSAHVAFLLAISWLELRRFRR